jgi:hypothetical protein
MKIKINTTRNPSQSLESLDDVQSQGFNSFVQGDTLPISIDLRLANGTLPYFWGSADYGINIALGDIPTRTTYAESGQLENDGNIYNGFLDVDSSALTGALEGNGSITASVQILVASATGMQETIMLTDATIYAE